MKIQLISPLLTQAALKKKGRKAKAKPIIRSKKIEIEYLSQLLGITNQCHKSIIDSIIPILKQ